MASGPLDGVRVLEFTQIIAGPLSCQLLADLGAEVIKIEPPHGEPWRLNAQFIPLESKTYQGLNRGKRSLAIDLGHPDARDVIYKLIPDIDVVIINYRPDVPARLGIDYETLQAIKPALIYADNTAFGREGPWANRPGYDIVVQAASGLMAGLGKLDEHGSPKVGGAYADYTTGYSLALAVSAALFYRAQTGKGQLIETSLLVNALQIQGQSMSLPAADAATRGQLLADLETREADGVDYAQFVRNHDRAPQIYYRGYATRDGAIAIGALSASLRDKVRQALGVEHNRDEPGYDQTSPEQQAIDRAVNDQVETMIRAESSAHWERVFQEHGVPVSKVHFVEELSTHPQVVENEYMVALDHDLSGPQQMAAPPWKMSESPPAAQGAAPPLGRDTDAILTAAGYSEDNVTAMRVAGLIR